MKKIIIFFLTFLCSCNSLKVKKGEEQSNFFKVEDIKSKNSWNIIYASKNDTLYKIITKKTESSKCNKIIIGNSYNIILNKKPKKPLIIDGIEIPETPQHVNCFGYDDETDICLERDKGINYLYNAKNIQGLCIKK